MIALTSIRICDRWSNTFYAALSTMRKVVPLGDDSLQKFFHDDILQ
ncbi:MAG: hypothetical protein R2807_09920 [Chitinophagales bacterium]